MSLLHIIKKIVTPFTQTTHMLLLLSISSARGMSSEDFSSTQSPPDYTEISNGISLQDIQQEQPPHYRDINILTSTSNQNSAENNPEHNNVNHNRQIIELGAESHSIDIEMQATTQTNPRNVSNLDHCYGKSINCLRCLTCGFVASIAISILFFTKD